jgi:hypothetical protein
MCGLRWHVCITGVRVRHVSANGHGDPFFLCFPQYEPCIERSTAWEAQAPRSHWSLPPGTGARRVAAVSIQPSRDRGQTAGGEEDYAPPPLELLCTVQMPVIELRCEEEGHGWDLRGGCCVLHFPLILRLRFILVGFLLFRLALELEPFAEGRT